ncbi:MAG: NAD-dependent epimerase/dehydratase family protein [Lachnospiraceae bacterium]|nr:NAD-dependent epimerase/dehydratase family protein [Lachnospiraceae bacterium]
MLIYNQKYLNSLENSIKTFPLWDRLAGSTILITGGTGLVCSYLVDMLMYCNQINGTDINVILTGRNEEKVIERFEKWFFTGNFIFVKQDLSMPLNISDRADYIIHGAGNAYPALFDKDPVGTMKTALYGTDGLLEYAVRSGAKNFVYISSGEIYGERDISEGVAEDFCGYTNYMDSRSCYPVSKMAAETLCASYSKQYGLHTNVARLCHVYGPTMTSSDNRVINQFLRNVLAGEDIVMKSAGSKVRSYCYVADAVAGLLYILVNGENSVAYNVAYEESVVSIRKIAELVAGIADKKVIMSGEEEAGGTKIEKSVLNNDKLKGLGWMGRYDMKKGLEESYNILSEL